LRVFLAGIALVCGGLAGFARSAPIVVQDVLRADGWVTDLADLITPADEATLESELEAWKKGSGHEIAVLTVPSLGSRTIEEYALNVARTWAMGQKGLSDAALLVISKNDRKMRIEVGRGLEGDLTDLVTGRIVRDLLTPAFKRGDFSTGIVQGVRAMRAAAGGDLSYLPKQRASAENWVPAIFITIILVMFIVRMLRAAGGMARGMPMSGRRSIGSRGAFGGFGGFSGGGGRSSGGGFSGFGGGGGFSGGGSSGGW